MTNIIPKGLPWPSYAWPLSEVPFITLEQLCIRAVQMETKWDAGRLGGDSSKFFRCIQRPWNSITWMTMLRSRWLLVQLNAGRLELWDIESPFTSYPVSYFDGLEGMVDGYKLLKSLEESLNVVVSLGLVETVAGCSGLLDIDKDLALFSRSPSTGGAIAQCQTSAAMAILQSESEEPKLEYAVGAKVAGNVVVVVRRTAIELYYVDEIQRALKSAGQTPSRSNQVLPIQSIPFLGDEHAVRATFLSRPLHCTNLHYHGAGAIYLGIDRDKESTRTIRVLYPDISVREAGHRFMLSPPIEVLEISTSVDRDFTVLCMWGETGRRMVHVGDVGDLCVTGLSIPVGFETQQSVVPVEEREVFSWRIPDSRRDLARYFAFDEATGVCAVALGSGRIWIVDPFSVTGIRDEDVPLKKIEFRDPPDPNPSWRFIQRKPWAGEPGHRSAGLRDALLPLMATKIYRWFPGRNNPEAYGGVKWFVNEVLHIPGPATVLLVGTPLPYGYPLDSFEIVDVGGRFLGVYRFDDFAVYYIKLFNADITFDAV
ncbi:hypothetical protein FRC00_008177, partial [Tulasnella sp. 408]